MIAVAHHHQGSYNQHVQPRSIQVGDTAWLHLPTTDKLDLKYIGEEMDNQNSATKIATSTDYVNGFNQLPYSELEI